jgi:NHLM bacteriocin system ABC transporter ATP-binding protein
VSSPQPGREGWELPIGRDGVTIGRADDCTVALADGQVSRRHARIESRPDGVFLIDNQSGNGTWVGDAQVSEVRLAHGTRFRIGDTVFEFVAPPPLVEEQTLVISLPAQPPIPVVPETHAREFIVKVVASKGGEAVGAEYRVTGTATIGRGDDCAVAIKDNSASRRHATVEALEDGRFRIVDASSVNGLWMGERRVKDEVIDAGQQFRVGNTFFECQLPAAPTPESEGTMMMADLGSLMAKVAQQRIEDAGEVVSIAGNQAILLDDQRVAYYVVSGKAEVFTVQVKDGKPFGARSHFLTVDHGEAFFGVTQSFSEDGFLATSKSGVDIRRIPREELTRLAAEDADLAAQVAKLVDGWVSGLSTRLTRDISSRPFADVTLQAGAQASVAAGNRARPGEGVAWVPAEPDRLLFIGLSTLSPDETVLFPLGASTWIELAGEEAETMAVTPVSTTALLVNPALWTGLDYFHQVLCECEFINKRLALLDEYDRIGRKSDESDRARSDAIDAIGAVLAGKHTEPSSLSRVGGGQPLVEACRLIGDWLGVKIVNPAGGTAERSFEDHLNAIASHSRFRTRRIALKGEWWSSDAGPFLAALDQGGAPIAVIPRRAGGYECIDPTAKTRQTVTAEVAATLAPFGYCFYRPFPSGELTGKALVRFGARGLASDFRVLLAMGVVTGIFGAAAPYLTGQMIDNAIPQSNGPLLLQLGLGMLLATLATAAFKVTQSYAVVRVQSKMDYTLQAALWDRLLDLPSVFFRQYGAGDLAERAGGIDTIRGVVSRSGVTGVLGSISSVAYLVLMATYSFKLTMIAMVITLVIVGMTTAGNYWQLRYQRVESTQRGAISTLVLQLIAGIAKVRVCAAENHAFKVWAQKFSMQKRTGFSIGTVTNVVGTASSSFNILSSLGIFAALYYFKLSAQPGEPPPFTTGEFIAFNGAFGSFITAVQSLSDASLALLKAVPVFERLKPIITTPPETDETKSTPARLRGEISVSRLHFKYVQDSPWILKDVSFKIKPGEFIAFVGGSGCGKSTLLRLLLGFEKPQLGAIYYDGQDLSSLDSRAVRQQLGVVLQESRLLPTDIFRNIVGTSSRTMADAWDAATMAGLGDDIKAMPMGMHTVVSEGGGTFSGGQRQRLLIARALVNRPRVIFFDEATSALDNKAQKQVTDSMDRMDATRIVIAHRLSTIVNASRIFYFEGGEIREQGTYAELMAKNGLFALLAKRQIV